MDSAFKFCFMDSNPFQTNFSLKSCLKIEMGFEFLWGSGKNLSFCAEGHFRVLTFKKFFDILLLTLRELKNLSQKEGQSEFIYFYNII